MARVQQQSITSQFVLASPAVSGKTEPSFSDRVRYWVKVSILLLLLFIVG